MFGSPTGLLDAINDLKRQNATSHRIYTDRCTGSLVNIQPDKSGDAKPYEQKQVANLLRRRVGEDQ